MCASSEALFSCHHNPEYEQGCLNAPPRPPPIWSAGLYSMLLSQRINQPTAWTRGSFVPSQLKRPHLSCAFARILGENPPFDRSNTVEKTRNKCCGVCAALLLVPLAMTMRNLLVVFTRTILEQSSADLNQPSLAPVHVIDAHF